MLAACKADTDSVETGTNDTEKDTIDSAETGETEDTGLSPLGYSQTQIAETPPVLLPYSVAVDSVRRRAFVVSLSLPRIAEIDLDTARISKVHTLSDFDSGFPRIAVDGQGTLWISNKSESNPGIGFRPESSEQLVLESGLIKSHSVLGRSTGGAVFAGASNDTGVIRVVDADGKTLMETAFENELVRTLAATENGFAVLLVSDGGSARIVEYDENLAVLKECTDARGGDFMLALPNGEFLVTAFSSLYKSDCDGDVEQLQMGIENHQAFLVDDEILVLDRIGNQAHSGQVWGVARRFDTDLNRTTSYATGKNSGFGGIDSTTGLVWMNSEGTGELWAMEPDTGEVKHRVPLGLHLDEVLANRDEPGIAWVSGRLSNSILRINLNTGEVLAQNKEINWPLSPVLADGLLWVVDGLSADVIGLNPTTLVVSRSLKTGLNENPLLLLHDLGWHAGRNSLFLTHGADNKLYEINPKTGTVRTEWPLPGPVVNDTESTGLLEIYIEGDDAYTARTTDGFVARVDLEKGRTEATIQVPIEERNSIQELRWGLLELRGERLFYGPYALDKATLERDGDADIDATRLVAKSGVEWIAWRSESNEIVYLDDEDKVLRTQAIDNDDVPVPSFEWTNWWNGTLLYAGFGESSIWSLPTKPE